MTNEQLITIVFSEVQRARAKFPTWPTDPFHAFGVVAEEFGELAQAVTQHVYEPHKSDREAVKAEAVQLAAMAIRFIDSLDDYDFRKCDQHAQGMSIATKEVP